MTPAQIKIAIWGGAALIALWLTSRRSPIADVELGVGTVNGIYGNDTYYSDRPSGVPSTNPATNPEMRRLIDLSNRLIAEDDDE
jgi:hypothetical protein